MVTPTGAVANRTAEDVYKEATQRHQEGDSQTALRLYQEVLKSPGDASDSLTSDVLHALGALLVEGATCAGSGATKRHTQTQCHEACPQRGTGHREPVVVHAEKVEEGMRLLRLAINKRPKNAKYRRTLGVAFQRQGRVSEALEAFEFACDKDPCDVKSLLHMARLYLKQERPARAAEVYKAITALQPDHPSAHYHLACLYRQLKRTNDAAEAFRAHLSVCPHDSEAQFWLAALIGDASLAPSAPERHVAGLFDSYADDFDHHLVDKLEYKTPWVLMELLLSEAKAAGVDRCCAPPWQRAVDLGCGTGLMGPLIAPHMDTTCGQLEGVDLSQGMVSKAQQRGCYHRLAVAELCAYLRDVGENTSGSEQGAYDLVVAADVFVYVGDLQPVLTAGAAVSRTGALLAFSTEAMEASASEQTSPSHSDKNSCADTGFHLALTGRYRHAESYLRHVLTSTGWEVLSIQRTVIRMNAGVPVQGYLVIARRGDTCNEDV